MNKFFQSVASVLEVKEVAASTRFREIEGWCSLHAFGLLVLMENDWQSPIDLDRLQRLDTVGDLYREAFLAFAAKLLQVDRSRLDGATCRGELPEWDSVNHLRLTMEAETRFGVSYPLERIPFIECMEDFLNEGC